MEFNPSELKGKTVRCDVEDGQSVKGQVIAIKSGDTPQATQLLIDTGSRLATTLSEVFKSDEGTILIRKGYGLVPLSNVTSIEE